ncbi:MAG: DUF2953 domain-containing protein [Alkaliphilus sp.]
MNARYIFCFIILLTVFLIESKIKLHINITRKDNKDEIKLKVTAFYGLFRYTITIPFLNLIRQSALLKEKKLKFFHVLAKMGADLRIAGNTVRDVKRTESITVSEAKYMYEEALSIYRRHKKNIQYLEKKVTVEEFTWETAIGLDDAAITAISSGALWAIKSNIVSILLSRYKFRDLHVDVKPCYDNECIFTDINCIIMFKTGHIINAAIPIFLRKIKYGRQ